MPPPTTQNLGLVKAIFSGTTAPTNTSVIWEDTAIITGLRHKYYEFDSGTWELLSGSGSGGNANIVEITSTELVALTNAETLSLTTIYIVTDAPYRIAVQAEAVDKLGANGTIIDLTYSGQVYYNVFSNTIVNGSICDELGNTWNGCLPTNTILGADSSENLLKDSIGNTFGIECIDNQLNKTNTNIFGDYCSGNKLENGGYITLGSSCQNNIFEQSTGFITLGDNCVNNTFKQGIASFVFGNNLQNVTIEANTPGADYSNTTTYAFLYNKTYASTIFQSGGVIFHRYYDPLNDRIVVTNFGDLSETYIGGSGGSGVYISDANDNVFYSATEQSSTTLVGVCNKNIFHQNAIGNSLTNDGYENTFHQSAQNNVIGDTCHGNVFEIGASGNIVPDGSSYNTFKKGANNYILDTNCSYNTFGEGSFLFTFGAGLLNVTVEPNVTGADYSNLTNYAFLYGNSYSATIFTDGINNYHRYYDVDTDRIVITLMASPFTVSYIGGGGGGTQDLQSVTTEGATTTNSITFGPYAGINLDNSSYLKEGTFSFGDYNVVLSGIINAGSGAINDVSGWLDLTDITATFTKWSDLNGLYIKTPYAVTPSGYGLGDIGMHNPEPGTFNYYLAPVGNSAFNGIAYFLAPGNRSGWGVPNDNATTDTPVNYWRLCVLADYPYIYFTNPSSDPYNFPTTDWVPVDAGETPPLNQGSEYLANYDSGFDIQITSAGNKGISRFCTVGYEDNWQSGIKYLLDLNGLIREATNCFNFRPNNLFDSTKRFKVGSRWILDNGTTYTCTDATGGSAVWEFVAVGGGNTNILEIEFLALADLENAGTLSLTTLYIVTDSPEFPLMCKASALNKLGKTATIIDDIYSGQVFYDVQTNTVSNGTIYDANNNIFNGIFPSDITLGADNFNNTFNQLAGTNVLGDNCIYNTFAQNAGKNTLGANCEKSKFDQDAQQNVLGDNCTAITFEQGANSNMVEGNGSSITFEQGVSNNYLGQYCYSNTFKQYANGFTFGNYLQNVTIETGISGADYSDSIIYAFLYNKAYSATIFQSGGLNYHRYFDVANNRIVVTDLADPTTITYIGGGSGDMLKSTYDTDNSGVVDNAEAIIVIGRNATGSVLRKGTIVYINGSTGNRPNFVKAQANAESTSAGTFGVIVSDIANNADGNCCAIGYLDTLDTRSTATYPFTSDTLADGDTVYLSPTTAGYITNVKPSAPDHLVYLGKVTRTSPTNGTIIYRPQNGYEIAEIHDVMATAPSDKDALLYEASTSMWKSRRITPNDINTFVENLSFQDNGASIPASTYTLELYAAYAYTINQLKIISASGTCTVAVNINGTPVTGISAVSVSNSIATGNGSAANTVAIGDKVTLVTTLNSALTNLQASLKITRG